KFHGQPAGDGTRDVLAVDRILVSDRVAQVCADERFGGIQGGLPASSKGLGGPDLDRYASQACPLGSVIISAAEQALGLPAGASPARIGTAHPGHQDRSAGSSAHTARRPTGLGRLQPDGVILDAWAENSEPRIPIYLLRRQVDIDQIN